MTKFVTTISGALDPQAMAEELAAGIEADLPSSTSVDGALILATAATGRGMLEVGERLADRWSSASVFGTSFEGIIASGCLYRDEPGALAIAWPRADSPMPIPLILDPEEVEADRIAAAIGDRTGRSEFEPGDLILLFPDAHHSVGFEAALRELGPLVAPAVVAGSGASGPDGYQAQAFLAAEELPGALMGLFVPVTPTVSNSLAEHAKRVEWAGASLSASPWLEITKCRPRWIDELDGEPALDWVRRQLGLDPRAPIEPYLDRLLARVRSPPIDPENLSPDGDRDYEERYVIGLDDRGGSFSWPGVFSPGDQLALALPDAALARERLQSTVEGLPASSLLFQFACRARDETLHGDAGLEAAWLAHCARDRRIVGTIAPFQIAMSQASDACRILVHSTVLAVLGHP